MRKFAVLKRCVKVYLYKVNHCVLFICKVMSNFSQENVLQKELQSTDNKQYVIHNMI